MPPTPVDDGIRFRSQREDFPSQEVQDYDTGFSIKLIMAMGDMCAVGFSQMEEVHKMLAKYFDIEQQARSSIQKAIFGRRGRTDPTQRNVSCETAC
jgi:hypothetical protein